ncbi:mitochondrial inner membrane magnesium transporter Mfm1p [[Candida] jaroonii]|uniref:Mitochondrial inner membrane magnesium transporter Mfm1p n=1 Tax=[Candida] jaroonii TaxID=467808 RepID=A0ACA9YBX8_9ASCO|nr:mitochondrial inner membrane magnesium transporter Mfm1p [[Candida] jaroonii]
MSLTPIYIHTHRRLFGLGSFIRGIGTLKSSIRTFQYRQFSNGRFSYQDFNDSLRDALLTKSLTANKTVEEFIRCTVFDKHGDLVVQGKDLRRSDFMKSNGLVSRDLRKISKHNATQSVNYINLEVVPTIFTRNDCILLNLLNIRAMIKSDQVVLFDYHPSESSYLGTTGSKAGLNDSSNFYDTLIKELQQGLSRATETTTSGSLVYEVRALEIILNHVVKNLNTEMNVQTNALRNLLDNLEDSIESNKLRYLLIHSKRMTEFHRKASLVKDSLDLILSDDELLHSLYLSEMAANKENSHAEIELLIESYYVTVDEIVQKVSNLLNQTKSTNEIINIILDSNRNEMMLLSLKFGVGLLSMGFALYIAALYGMNLENFIEETEFGFPVVVSFSSVLLVFLILVSVARLRRVSKITMTGKGSDDRFRH